MQNRTYDLEALVCVYVVGGGGGYYSPLSFIYRSPRGEEDYMALRPLLTHAGYIHHHQEFSYVYMYISLSGGMHSICLPIFQDVCY